MDNNNPVNSAEQNGGQTQPKFQISKLPALPILAGLFILIILIIGVFYLTSSSKNKEIIAIQNQAQQAANSGDYKKAETILKKGLTSNPNNESLQSNLINIYSTQGNQNGTEAKSLEKSQPYIDQLNKSGNLDAATLVTMGYAYETAGDYEKALDYYTQATNKDPKFSLAWFYKGHAESFLNKIAEAKKDFETAYSLDPANPMILMIRGNQFSQDGKPQQAFDSYLKAAENAKGANQIQAEALSAASSTRRIQDNYQHVDEAVALAQKALDASPNFSPALAAYGNAIFLTGKTDSGIDYLKQAIVANPRISRNYADLGMLLRAQKNYNGSINSLQQALIKINNDNTLVTDAAKKRAQALYTYELALSYSISGQNQNVVELIQQALVLNPDLKTQLLYDYHKRGFFQELSNDPAFASLVQ